MNMTDSQRLAQVLSRTRCLLLDFDGPMCSIFAGCPAAEVAEALRQLIAKRGYQVPDNIRRTDDPLDVLRYTSSIKQPHLTHDVSEALGAMELTAVQSAVPTPSINDVLDAARRTNRTLVIVSNNSTDAVRAYLDRHHLSVYFHAVAGRHNRMDPQQLKPSCHLIGEALTQTNTTSPMATLVGDSTSDIEAARSASIASIGYANRPGKLTDLTAAGADAVVTDMATLARAIGSSSPSQTLR